MIISRNMYKKEEALKEFYSSHPTGGNVTSIKTLVRTLEALEVEMKGDVLDLGCSQGHSCFHVKQMGAKPLGIDYTKVRIKNAKKNYPELKFMCMDMHRFLETTNLSFDIIMLFDAIEHLEKPATLIKKARKVLKDGGVIISRTPMRMPYEAHLQVFNNVEDFFDKLSPTRAIEDGGSILALWNK